MNEQFKKDLIKFIELKAEKHNIPSDDIFISISDGKVVIDELESSGNGNNFKSLEVI